VATTRVSVIICAYAAERWEELAEAVASAAHQDPGPEVIVVVDHNPDLLARARRQFLRVRVIPNRHAQGLSGARNSGIEAATGEIVAFLDDDAYAASGWLARLCAHYTDARVVGVGGSIEPCWSTDRPVWFPQQFDWVVGCTYAGMRESAGPVRNLIGANMSFRRTAIAAAGGFRDGVGQVGAGMLRCDDTEFCIRLGQAMPGRILLYEPSARVFHHVTPARARWSYFRRRCYTEGIAKAMIARLVGRREGLASERSYTLKTLPSAVARDVCAAYAGRGARHFARAGAIVVGFTLTVAGYVVGAASARGSALTAKFAVGRIAMRHDSRT